MPSARSRAKRNVRALGPHMEDLLLRRGALTWKIKGAWTRSADGSTVIALGNTLETTPRQGDRVEDRRLGFEMLVFDAEGVDEVYWSLDCATPLPLRVRPPAPEFTATADGPAGSRVATMTIAGGEELLRRARMRRRSDAYWTRTRTTEDLIVVFENAPDGNLQFGLSVIQSDGRHSQEALVNV